MFNTPEQVVFWSKVRVGSDDECWEWQGYTQKNGYGSYVRPNRFRHSKTRLTHRIAYELVNGPIPDGYEIDHLCKTRNCCNPAHLEAVTKRENIMRSTSFTAIQAAQESCVNGHPLSGSNLYIHPKTGFRKCKECRRIRLIEWRKKQPTEYWKRYPSRQP